MTTSRKKKVQSGQSTSTNILNRFTSLPIVLDLLKSKQITLLSPETWEDRNDAYYLERYKDVRKLRSLLAVCFSMRTETFHHWRVFSYGASGVCIEFDKLKLLKTISNQSGFTHKNVEYRKVKDLEKSRPNLDTWPFIKRLPFKDENEYRIVFESKSEFCVSKRVDIGLESIRKITLSPWLPESISESVIQVIKSIDGCSELRVNRSSLINNETWKTIVRD